MPVNRPSLCPPSFDAFRSSRIHSLLCMVQAVELDDDMLRPIWLQLGKGGKCTSVTVTENGCIPERVLLQRSGPYSSRCLSFHRLRRPINVFVASSVGCFPGLSMTPASSIKSPNAPRITSVAVSKLVSATDSDTLDAPCGCVAEMS